jgi:hypothetical protein
LIHMLALRTFGKHLYPGQWTRIERQAWIGAFECLPKNPEAMWPSSV